MFKFRILMIVPALWLSLSPPLLAQEGEEAAEEVVREANSTHEVDVEAETAAALEATTAWLELLDAGEYEETWNEAAAAFQAAVTVGNWIASVVQARTNFEPFGERVEVGSRYMTDIPNAPPGEYVVFQFRTAVAGDRTVIETVTPMKEQGAWKVSGYFVRPD
ncbi:MAG: DUF4019 domain-containing protein [Gemmatimonadota bacterium]